MDVSFLKRWLQVLIDDFWEEFFGLTFLEDRNGSYGYHLSVVVCGLKELKEPTEILLFLVQLLGGGLNLRPLSTEVMAISLSQA